MPFCSSPSLTRTANGGSLYLPAIRIIPAALAAAIVGVTGLHNIPPKPMMRRTQKQFTPSGFVCGPGFAFPCELVTPADLATIYNFNQAFNGGITGKGQTIYLVENSDIYTNGGTVNDWATFRTGFGIPVANYPGASLTTIHPNCADPGVNGDDSEAIIDARAAPTTFPFCSYSWTARWRASGAWSGASARRAAAFPKSKPNSRSCCAATFIS